MNINNKLFYTNIIFFLFLFIKTSFAFSMFDTNYNEVNFESIEIANKVTKTLFEWDAHFNRKPSGEDLCSLHEILKVERLNIPLELINEILQMSQEPMYLEPIMEHVDDIREMIARQDKSFG